MATDPWSKSDSLDEAQLQVMVQRLEARATHPKFMAMLDEYLDAMGIDRADRVIDLGCGTGVGTRAIVRRPGFQGSVVGVDLSPHLVEVARQRAQADGTADRAEFRAGDTTSLDIGDASFDAAIAQTLLSHVPDPAAVVREAARVVRPGGMLGLFDADYASLTFGHPDSARGQAYDAVLSEAIVASPRVMRDMPRILATAGLERVATLSSVLAEVGTADYWASAIEMLRRLVPSTGAMTESEMDAWAASQWTDAEAGVFFAACTFYAYIARRP